MKLTGREIETMIAEKHNLIEREVNRASGKLYKQGMADIDDLRQEALRAFCWAVEAFDPEKRPMSCLDAWIVTSMQNQLNNTLWKTHRKLHFLYDDPATIENEPEPLQMLMPSKEDLDILVPLSEDARMFLDCVFAPSVELKQRISSKWFSGKPHCHNILPIVLEWLGWDQTKFAGVRSELTTKVQYQAA